MNPPFGTKNNEEILEIFVEKAIKISKGPVYILHKTNYKGLEKISKKNNKQIC